MKIAEIRDTLNASQWMRNDYCGHTSDEFTRANVGERLGAMMDRLRALEIAPRFAHEIGRRDHELAACAAVIARWLDKRAALAPAPKPSAIIYQFPTGRRVA
jgi:hypothetical protein